MAEIVGYQRVADGDCCDFCTTVDGAYLKSADPLPLHNNCGCSVEPIMSDDPRAVKIKSARRGGVPQPKLPENPTTLGADDIADAVAIQDHGELGPLLTDPTHGFTDDSLEPMQTPDPLPGGVAFDLSETENVVPDDFREAQDAIGRVLDFDDDVKIIMLPESDSATARMRPGQGIAVHDGKTSSVAVTHEYAHWLDSEVLGDADDELDFWSDHWGTNPLARELHDALEQTSVIKRIRAGEEPLLKDDPKLTAIFLQSREQMARAFEQYIAIRSGDQKMLDRISRDIETGLGLMHFDPDELAPAMRVFDRIFREKGLLR